MSTFVNCEINIKLSLIINLTFIYDDYYNLLPVRNASDRGSHVVRGILLGPLVIDCHCELCSHHTQSL